MKIELVAARDGERFQVHNVHEIGHILRSIADSGALVALYAAGNQDFILSSIVALDVEQGYLLFEQGADSTFNQRLVNSASVTCATTSNHVHVQFTVQTLRPAMMGDRPVFQTAIPRSVIRMQRREYYRLPTSVMEPVTCTIGTKFGPLRMRATDISISGIGVGYDSRDALEIGRTYEDCVVVLPGALEFRVNLDVRNIYEALLPSGRRGQRAGCRFNNLGSSIETEIQRYIIRLERERRAREIGDSFQPT